MRNQADAVSRRMTDPEFQASVVNRCIALALGMFGVLAVVTSLFVWQWINREPPRLFIVDGKTPPRAVVGLDSPIADDTELLEWSVRAMLAPYNVDYFNYAQQLNTASRRFTPNGWNTFADSFVKTGNFDEIKRARLNCHAQAQRAALIHNTSFARGALTYEIEMPIVQTCENVNQVSTQTLLVAASVIRINSDDHPDGLAIDQLVARLN